MTAWLIMAAIAGATLVMVWVVARRQAGLAAPLEQLSAVAAGIGRGQLDTPDRPASRRSTTSPTAAFGGDAAAFARVNPLDEMRTGRYAGSSGLLVVGRDDDVYRPQAELIAAAARSSVAVVLWELPGGHSWAIARLWRGRWRGSAAGRDCSSRLRQTVADRQSARSGERSGRLSRRRAADRLARQPD